MAAFIEMMLGLIIMKWNCLHVEDCKQVRSYLLILLITLKKQIQLSRCKSPMLFVRPWFNWFKLSYILVAITKFNIFKPGCSIRIFHTTLTEKKLICFSWDSKFGDTCIYGCYNSMDIQRLSQNYTKH